MDANVIVTISMKKMLVRFNQNEFVDSRQKLWITCLHYLSQRRKAFAPTSAPAIQALMDWHCSHDNYHEEVDGGQHYNPLYSALWVCEAAIHYISLEVFLL